MSRALCFILAGGLAGACTGDAQLGTAPTQSDSGAPDAGTGGSGPSDAGEDTGGMGGAGGIAGSDGDAGPGPCIGRCVPDSTADAECSRIDEILDTSLMCPAQTTCCRVLPECDTAGGQCAALTGGGLSCPAGTMPAPEVGFCGIGAGCCQ